MVLNSRLQQPRELNDTIREQINKMSHVTLRGLAHKLFVDFSQRLLYICEHAQLSSITLIDTGFAAVEATMKLAVQCKFCQDGRK